MPLTHLFCGICGLEMKKDMNYRHQNKKKCLFLHRKIVMFDLSIEKWKP